MIRNLSKRPQEKFILRQLLMTLLTVFIFVAGAASVRADAEVFSDALWFNGNYDSTLGDMAGRRLYVYGLADNMNGGTDNLSDDRIDLASNQSINRLELAGMLYRLCGSDSAGSEYPFSDVPDEYADAVAWMYSIGVTRGVSSERYGTGDVTRVQFLTMLSRLFSWDGGDSDMQWGDLGYEDQMMVLARENNLFPVGMSSGDFTHGDVYLIFLALAEQRFPEILTPVRAEMSRPRQITLTAASFLDAEEQIAIAMQYAPTRIYVNFSKDCPAVDLKAFREKIPASTVLVSVV